MKKIILFLSLVLVAAFAKPLAAQKVDSKGRKLMTAFEGVPGEIAPGVILRSYFLGDYGKLEMPKLKAGQLPSAFHYLNKMVYADYNGTSKGIIKYPGSYLLRFSAFLNIPETRTYAFRLRDCDAAILEVDNKQVIDHQKYHKGVENAEVELFLEKGYHAVNLIVAKFNATESYNEATLWWFNDEKKDWEYIPEAFWMYEKPAQNAIPGVKQLESTGGNGEPKLAFNPGDEFPVSGVHPSFKLTSLHSENFKPRVGGMGWLPDGRLVVCTWDSLGQVFIVDNTQKGDANTVKVKRIATGLAEPLGLTVVKGNIYVLQKQELTQLVDLNGDDLIDEFRTVANGWGVTDNFHEFCFGLVWADSVFYAATAIGIMPGGRSAIPQNKDRGKCMKIRLDGSHEFVASGLRTPNGVGLGVDNELFITDNQGDWLPSCKLLHVTKGAFFNNYAVELNQIGKLTAKPPVVWLPQNEIGNSPGNPVAMNVGPYKNQMLHGEVTYGGLQRTYIEKVKGEYQGCVFKFSQGMSGGVNRITWGPDGNLYIGEIGNPGNWGHYGHTWYGLERLEYTGAPVFEMLSMSARKNGFLITFTEPVAKGMGEKPSDYQFSQWYYEPTMQYGGPKKDMHDLGVASVSMAADRKSAFIEVPGCKQGYVIYAHLGFDRFKSEAGLTLWSTEGWYTLNNIPEEKGVVSPKAVKNPAVKASADAATGTNAKPKVEEPKVDPLKDPATLLAGAKLVTSKGCRGCHADDKKVLGPAFQDISNKYRKDPKALAKLVTKVQNGGSGVWGDYPMAAQSHVGKEQINKMVAWVLSLK